MGARPRPLSARRFVESSESTLALRNDSRVRDLTISATRAGLHYARHRTHREVGCRTDEMALGFFSICPQGLVFQVTEKGLTVQLTKAPLLTRGLADGSVRFEADDVVKIKVIPVYTSMLSNRGRYLAALGRHEDAVEAFRQALEIEPGFGPAQKALNDSQSALRKSRRGTDP